MLKTLEKRVSAWHAIAVGCPAGARRRAVKTASSNRFFQWFDDICFICGNNPFAHRRPPDRAAFDNFMKSSRFR
jgi:hypothetical protein